MKIKLASIPVCLGWDSCDHIPSSESYCQLRLRRRKGQVSSGMWPQKSCPAQRRMLAQIGFSELQRKEAAMKFEGTMGV